MIRRHHFIYLRDRRFVFTYVPKVACTNWKALLRHLSGYSDYLDSSLAHDRARSGLTFLSDLDEWESILADPSIARYTFVRNPYSRVLSAYLNKVEPYVRGDGDWQRKAFRTTYELIDEFRKRATGSPEAVSFRVFLEWLARSGDEAAADEHWLPQTEIVAPSQVSYDFVGRFERLERDSAVLMERMGCTVPFPTREALEFPGTNSAQLLADYYAAPEIELVQSLYTADFAAFGYSLDFAEASRP